MTVAEIAEVEANSLAEELGLAPGDKIIRVNEVSIKDIIQFQFEWAGEEVSLEVEKVDGSLEVYELEKDYDESLGVVFKKAVFDQLKVCHNKCLFCFVDQMPYNMRPTLYEKDDDFRLSFLQGSFITLTNLSKSDLERIKKEHLSPLYVSVHTTDPELRVKLLKNPKAGGILDILRELDQVGIEFHTQVVLCPGLNDGKYLEKTFRDLLEIEGVRSLAIVPVGITKYRENLIELHQFDQARAQEIVHWVREKQTQGQRKRESNFVWLSDEFYIIAQGQLPSYEDYEDFPQLENGVGLVRLLWHEFAEIKLPQEIPREKSFTIVTGVSGQAAIGPLIDKLNKIRGLTLQLKVVENSFFGPAVTVTGLLTGHCLREGLRDLAPGTQVLIPAVMLKTQEDRFLDDLTPEDITEELGISLQVVPVSAKALVEQVLGL